MNPSTLFVLGTFGLLASCSCSSRNTRPASPQPPAPPPTVAVGGDVLATVNGVPIMRADLAVATASLAAGHGGDAPPTEEETLERIIREEVLAQRAMAAHLDGDAEYREELARREAQLAAWKRERLADLFHLREASRPSLITEADERRYYDANAARIRTEVRVSQIMLRDEARANEALRDLHGGATFDSIAARQFPVLPDRASRPWELPFLPWNQVPEPWLPVIDGIAVGQTSDLIRGPGGRFWIIEVLERRENPAQTFEATRPVIATLLREQSASGARTRLEQEARQAATVVYSHPPTPEPSPEPARAPSAPHAD